MLEVVIELFLALDQTLTYIMLSYLSGIRRRRRDRERLGYMAISRGR